MRLDRGRRAGIGRERAALLVADRPKQAVELLRAAVHVVGDRGTPVKEERRRALAADVTVERSALDRDLERLLVHQPETTRTWRNMLCAAGGALDRRETASSVGPNTRFVFWRPCLSDQRHPSHVAHQPKPT